MKGNFYKFVQERWPLMKPRGAFRPTVQAKAICDALEEFTSSKISNLIITAPPGCGKSAIASVMWPCWLWESMRPQDILLLAHHHDLATKSIQDTAGLLNSLGMLDRDKEFTQNCLHGTTGSRMNAHQVGGALMGLRPDLIIVDQALSPNARLAAKEGQLVDYYLNNINLKRTPLGKMVIIETPEKGCLSRELISKDLIHQYVYVRI